MKTWMIAAALAAGLAGAAANVEVAHAKPAAKAAKPIKAAKPTKAASLAVCPVMQHPVPRDAKNSLKYANMTVYFCCPSCRAKFKGMAPAAQKSRIQAARKVAAKSSA